MFNKISKWDKNNFLLTIQSQIEAGEYNFIKMTDILITYYMKIRKKYMAKVLQNLKSHLVKGTKISTALFKAGIINENEKDILEKAKSLDKGLERIININKTDSQIVIGMLLLLSPPLILITALLIGRPYIEQILTNMVQPIIDVGGQPPPLPPYLTDNKILLMWNILMWGATIVYFGMLYLFSKSKPKYYFQLLPLLNYKYSYEILKNIKDFIDSGLSVSDTVEILSKIEKNPIKRNMYREMSKRFKQGRNDPISSVLEENGINLITVMLVQQGEMGTGSGKNYHKYITIAEHEADVKYHKYVKTFVKASFWIGQFLMMGVALKPLVDVLLYTSIQQMNFKLG